MSDPTLRREKAILALLGGVQFVNILDFMMVMPLGPDFGVALGVPISRVGVIATAYTAAAFFSGLWGSFFLDRFDRRRALLVAVFGLSLATFLGGFAPDFPSLLGARVVAGLFGGPATSLALAMVADVVPVERRGRAMGAVMGAFSVASVLGVPIAVRLASLAGWRTPFFVVGAAGFVAFGVAAWLLPAVRGHIDAAKALPTSEALRGLLSRPAVRLSWGMTFAVMSGGFILIPNLSAHVQANFGYPRERIDLLYMVGGALSFFALRWGGRLIDRFGVTRLMWTAALTLLGVQFAFFVQPPSPAPVMVLFVAFMTVMSLRNVAHTTLASRVPRPFERARFMGIQAAVQNLASAAASYAGGLILVVRPDGRLGHAATLGLVAMVLTAAIPVLAQLTHRQLERSPPALGGPVQGPPAGQPPGSPPAAPPGVAAR